MSRILPFFLPLILLAGCVGPRVTDTQEPPTIIVPHMAQPLLDGNLDPLEWADAITLTGEFVIADGSKASGIYNFSVQLGAGHTALHVAVHMPKVPPNPWSNSTTHYSDSFYIFFMPGLRGPLGEGGYVVHESVAQGPTSWHTTFGSGLWTGTQWFNPPEGQDEGGNFNDGKPTGGKVWAPANLTNGDYTMEMYIPRKSNATWALHLGPEAEFRLCFAFKRFSGPENRPPDVDARGGTLLDYPHDTYPPEGYTPDGAYSTEGWIPVKLTV